MGKVLIACESSGTVRRAFESLGHDSWSCDIKPSEDSSNRHITADVLDVLSAPELYGRFDLAIVCHPPCTRLCASGVRWLSEPPTNPPSSCIGDESERWADMNREQRLALMWEHLRTGADLFDSLLNHTGAPMIACENPVMHSHAKALINFGEVKPFYVQPWQFATSADSVDNEKKRTGFWARNLPALIPTGSLDGSSARDSVHKASPGKNRSTDRSRFFPGMAAAMAEQWGQLLPQSSITI